MKCMNLALEQIQNKSKQKKIFNEHDFFEEYFNVFNDSDKFHATTIDSLKKISREDIVKISNLLEQKVQEKLERILEAINLDVLPGMIMFIGDGSWDGHGIILQGSPYVFFDLTAVIKNKNDYNLDTYITHELLHSIHYAKQNSFYPSQYKTIKEKYLKKLIAEGLATFLGNHYTDYQIEESYWLGVLTAKEVEEWENNCKKEKNKIGRQLKEQINSSEFDKSLFYQLFSITSPEYTKHRFGYYYGTQIVKKAFADKTAAELLTAEFDEYEKDIDQHFQF